MDCQACEIKILSWDDLKCLIAHLKNFCEVAHANQKDLIVKIDYVDKEET